MRIGRASAPVLSLRAKFLFIVLGAALAPLALLGFWLTRSAERSGEELLRVRLDSGLTRVARDIGSRWVRERSALLALAENAEVRRSLAGGPDPRRMSILVSALGQASSLIRNDVRVALVRDASSRPRWILAMPDDSSPPRLVVANDTARLIAPAGETITVTFAVYAPESSVQVGTVEVQLHTNAIVESGAANTAGVGAVIATLDRSSGTSLLPLPFDPTLLERDRFRWAGDEWITARKELDEPAITLIAAAPLEPFTAPFQHAARVGGGPLAITAAAFVVTMLLTGRLTRSLEQLASGADAVSRGDLDPRVDVRTRDEVGRVAQAFNTMTDSLRRTLRQLSDREAVAAVGEFASALAHEVRNPLSAIRLNLQYAEEKLADRDGVMGPVTQALRDVERLERTVAGALRVARSGRMEMETVDVMAAIDAACRSAQGEFTARGTTLESPTASAAPVSVHGNAAALEQLFLNILLNAAQALEPGGRAGITVTRTSADYEVIVWDTGCGLSPNEREHAFEPFYTTKSEGTGLGLAIVRRIVTAHGGRAEIDSTPGSGTRVVVSLPACADA